MSLTQFSFSRETSREMSELYKAFVGFLFVFLFLQLGFELLLPDSETLA